MKFFRLTSSGRVCTIKILQICRAEISYKNNGVTNMQNILIVVDMQNDFIDGTLGTNGSWKKESAEGSNENHLGIDGNIFAQEGKALESFHLSEQETTVNGKACYQLYGDVTGTELMGLLGKEMVEAYHLVNLPEEDAIRNLKIPVIFDIYKEELLPAKIVVDMSDVMGDLYKSYGETTKVNLYSIVLQFTDYNKVDEIHVPDEIKNSAK